MLSDGLDQGLPHKSDDIDYSGSFRDAMAMAMATAWVWSDIRYSTVQYGTVQRGTALHSIDELTERLPS